MFMLVFIVYKGDAILYSTHMLSCTNVWSKMQKNINTKNEDVVQAHCGSIEPIGLVCCQYCSQAAAESA